MKKLRKILMTFFALLMTVSLVACGGSGDKDTGDGEDKLVMGFSQIGAESNWRTANTDDIKRAAKDAGVELQFSDAQQKQENQIKALRSFIANDVDIIVLTPIVENGWDTVLKEAKDADIPVLIVDRDLKVEDEDLYVAKIGTDQLEEGRKSWDKIESLVGELAPAPKADGKLGVVVLEGTVGSSAAESRKKGFYEKFDASANKGNYTILEEQTGEFTRAKGKEVMESFLKSYDGKINILYAHNDDMAIGAIQAIEEAGLKPGEDIIIVSCDAIKDAFQAMVDGKLNATIECNPLQGDLVMETAKKIVAGEEVERVVYVDEGVFDQSNAAELIGDRKY